MPAQLLSLSALPRGKSGHASVKLRQLLLGKGIPSYSDWLTKEAFVPNTHKSQINISVLAIEDTVLFHDLGGGVEANAYTLLRNVRLGLLLPQNSQGSRTSPPSQRCCWCHIWRGGQAYFRLHNRRELPPGGGGKACHFHPDPLSSLGPACQSLHWDGALC